MVTTIVYLQKKNQKITHLKAGIRIIRRKLLFCFHFPFYKGLYTQSAITITRYGKKLKKYSILYILYTYNIQVL